MVVVFHQYDLLSEATQSFILFNLKGREAYPDASCDKKKSVSYHALQPDKKRRCVAGEGQDIRTDIVTACVDYTTRYLNGEGRKKKRKPMTDGELTNFFFKRGRRKKR